MSTFATDCMMTLDLLATWPEQPIPEVRRQIRAGTPLLEIVTEPDFTPRDSTTPSPMISTSSGD